MKNIKRGHKFRIGSLIFVIVNYDDTSHKYLCRLQNTGEIYYFSPQQIFKNSQTHFTIEKPRNSI